MSIWSLAWRQYLPWPYGDDSNDALLHCIQHWPDYQCNGIWYWGCRVLCLLVLFHDPTLLLQDTSHMCTISRNETIDENQGDALMQNMWRKLEMWESGKGPGYSRFQSVSDQGQWTDRAEKWAELMAQLQFGANAVDALSRYRRPGLSQRSLNQSTFVSMMRTFPFARYMTAWRRHCMPAGNSIDAVLSSLALRTVSLFCPQLISSSIMSPVAKGTVPDWCSERFEQKLQLACITAKTKWRSEAQHKPYFVVWLHWGEAGRGARDRSRYQQYK